MDEEWDPRKEDYEDLSNRFNKGPAKHLSTTMFNGKRKPIQLFVTGIPLEMTEMALRALFERTGTVTEVKKCLSKKPEMGFTFGFITMATLNDAEKAMRDLNEFKAGPHTLRVRVARALGDQGNSAKQDLSVQAVKSTEDSDAEEPKEKMNGFSNEKSIQNLPTGGRGIVIKKVVQAVSPVGLEKPSKSAQTSLGNRPFKQTLLPDPLYKLDDIQIPVDNYLSISRKINDMDNSKYQHFDSSHQSVRRGNQYFMQGARRGNYHMSGVGRGYQQVWQGSGRGMNNMCPGYPDTNMARSMEWNNFSRPPVWNDRMFGRGRRNWGDHHDGNAPMFRGRDCNDYGDYQHQYGDMSHPMMGQGASFYGPPFQVPYPAQTDFGQMSNNCLLKTASPRSNVQSYVEVQQPVKLKAKKAELSMEIIQECSVCQKLGSRRCSRCKLPYCGVTCQTEDWERHKILCKTIQMDEELSQAFESQFDLTVGDELIPQVKTLMETALGESIEITRKATSSHRNVPGNDTLDINMEKSNERANSKVSSKGDKNDRQMKSNWQGNKQNWSESQKVVDQKEVNIDGREVGSLERQHGKAVEDKAKLNKVVDECKPVHTLVSSGQQSLSNFTSHEDMSAKKTKTLITSPNMWIPAALSMPENLEMEVVVTYAVDLDQFWVSTKECKAATTALSKKMEQKYQSRACDVNKVMEGNFYACRHFTTNWAWYRVKVIKVDGKDLVVQFIDFGNKETTNVSKLRQLDGDLEVLPAQGIACTLHGVAPRLGNQWNIPVKKLQEFITNNMKYFMTCKKVWTGPTGQIHEVVLRNVEGLDVAQQLVSVGLVRSLLDIKPGSLPGSYPAKPGSYPVGGANASPILAKTLQKVSSTVAVGQEIQFIILDAQSPDNFTIQITHGDAVKHFANFQAQLNKEYDRSPITQYRPQCEGELVVSRFTGDNQKEWYRAEVTKITDTGADVVYIDYLNSDMVVFSMLRKATSLCLSVPAQGISCTLSDINKPADGKWPPEISALYAELTTNQLKGLVKKFENGVLCLEFYTPDGKSVNKIIKSLLSNSLFKQTEKKMLKIDETYKSPKVVSQTLVSPKVMQPIDLLLTVTAPQVMSPKVVRHPIKVVEMSEIPLDGSSNRALFTAMTKGHCIYVQLCDEALQARLVAIMQQLNECGLVGGFKPKLGDYVSAQFTDNDETLWYRARVEKILNEMYTVFFLDYGNSEIVTSKYLSKLDEIFLDLPMMAIQCQLAACEDIDSTWLIEQLQLLINKMVQVKAVDYQNGIFKVLMYLDGNNINDLVKSAWKEHAENQKSAELKPTINNEQVKTSAEQMTILEMKLSLNSELVNANVVLIENLASFYIHICDEEMQKNLQELLQNLNGLCANDSCPYSPEIGNYVAALYSDGKDEAIWYRAQVLDLNDSQVQSQVQVFIVDYGNVGWVKKNCIRKLDEKFAALPAFAIKCKLVGATGNEAEDMKAEFMYVMQVVVKIKVVLKERDAYVVDMFIGDRDESLNSVAEFLGLKASENQKSSPVGSNCAIPSVNSGENSSPVAIEKSKKQNAIADVSPRAGLRSPVNHSSFLPIGSKVSVATFVVDSLSTFYVQKTDSETQTLLGELMLKLEEECLKNHTSYEPIIGELVAAYYDDGEYKRWYRGVVEDKLEDNKFKVMFIDYGNVDVVGHSDIQKLNPMFCTLPRLAIRCSLQGITGKEDEHILRDFKASVMNVEVYVIAESFQNESYMVEMFLTDGRNINSELGLGQIDKATNIVVKSPKAIIVSPEKLPNRLASPRVERKKVFMQTLPKSGPEGINVDISVIITNVVKPNDFQCQLYHTDNKALVQILLLCQNINETTMGVPEVTDFEKGELCCAKFPEDNCWYRATILDVFPDKTVQVKYVDYGNKASIPVSLLCPVMEELSRIPLLAFSCSLHGVAPVGSSWTDEVVHALSDFQNKPLSAKVIRVCDNIYELDINDQGVSIADSLITAGLAKRPLRDLEINEVEEKRKKLEMLQRECAMIQAQLGQLTKEN